MNRNHFWVAGAVSAMFGLSLSVAQAQDTTSSSMSGVIPARIDYTILTTSGLNFVDLQAAAADGYSEDEIASMAILANKSGWPFNSIVSRVQNGATFASLADAANLPISSVYDTTDEKQKIDDYKAAYMTTGGYTGAPSSMADMASMPDSSSNASMATDSSMSTTAMANMNIMDIAKADKNLSTFVKLVTSAGLDTTLMGTGPYTVFAPTNYAFSKIPKATLDSLANDPDRLKSVLTYHIIPARVDAATAMAMTSPTSPPTVQGDTLQVVTKDGKVMINDATVTKADIIGSNGIIHEIDTVLMPGTATAQ